MAEGREVQEEEAVPQGLETRLAQALGDLGEGAAGSMGWEGETFFAEGEEGLRAWGEEAYEVGLPEAGVGV